MADRFYSINLGGDKVSVAETGTTTAGAAVELRVTYTATGLTKQDVLKCLEQLECRVAEDNWPPV